MTNGIGFLITTFSIVGYDPANGDLGVAVATKYLAVGSGVPHAAPLVGAIAVQAYANPVLGPRGLELLARGVPPQQAVDTLMSEDEGSAYRQLGIVDAQGRAVSYTGEQCEEWAGGMVGPNCAAQGNMLVGESTVRAMVDCFVERDGPLADRLVAALRAGERAGGDKRGRQSSALLVVRPRGGLPIYDERLIDLRVDSDPQPCRRLRRLLDQYYQLYASTPREEFLPLTKGRVEEVQLALFRLGRYGGQLQGRFDDATRKALWGFCVAENQKDRWSDKDLIDPRLLKFVVKFADGDRA
jgi:uncharacterized Ntn-hydrolase superfamily protein